MAIIELTKGQIALVDDDDVALLSPFSWYAQPQSNGRFYAQARVEPGRNGRRDMMHRFLMRPPPGFVVHHINNDGLDNRRSNLVVTTYSRNLAAATHTEKTGYWRIDCGFQAMTRIDKTRFNLGVHATEEQAQRAVSLAREALPWLPIDEAKKEAKRIAYRVRMGLV